MGSSVRTFPQRCTDWEQRCYSWGRLLPSPWPSPTAPQALSPSPDLARTGATLVTTTSSTSTCQHTRPLSGVTGEGTLIITGKSTSVKRTTHSRPSWSGTIHTTVTESTTSTTTTVAATRSPITSLPMLLQHLLTMPARNPREPMWPLQLLGILGTDELL